MRSGQDGARSDDTSALKKQIPDMLWQYDRAAAADLDSKDKATRGFNHPLTGRLLCPAKLDSGDETYAIQCSLKSGKYDLQPTDWPTFFYKGHKYDPDDEMKGLLQGELLIQAFKCIFLGPSAWLRNDGKSKIMHSPKAALCEMEAVTSRSLAYVATLTYFGLSSNKKNQKVGGSFELSTLYWQVVHLLEDKDLKDEANTLLLWWNQQIFPSKSSAK
ncbi:hypothetical protein K439DRAFT_1240134, partial [Ramaria rubella]